jgi:modulator of FtsH protease
MADPVVVQEWQPFFMTLAGASAALAGLVFVAMSLHPGPILSHPIMRARAFGAAFGFLLAVAWALIMLLPARTAPIGSCLLIALGGGASLFFGARQIQLRTAGMNVALVVLADLVIPVPLLAGIVGLLQPRSAWPFLLLAISSAVGLFILFFQSWTLVLHSALSADETPTPTPQRTTDK